MNEWKRWFAWYPVTLQNGRIVWLRSVEYRQFKFDVSYAWPGGVSTVTHYRLPDDAPEFRMGAK